MSLIKERFDKVLISEKDKRLYRGLELQNRLKVRIRNTEYQSSYNPLSVWSSLWSCRCC